MQMIHEQNAIVKLLRDNDIHFVILKGTASAIYYPVPSDKDTVYADFTTVIGDQTENVRIILVVKDGDPSMGGRFKNQIDVGGDIGAEMLRFTNGVGMTAPDDPDNGYYRNNSRINKNQVLNQQISSFQSNSNEENKSGSKYDDSNSKKSDKKPHFYNNLKFKKYLNMNYSLNNNVNINSSEYHKNNTYKYFQSSNGINLRKKIKIKQILILIIVIYF